MLQNISIENFQNSEVRVYGCFLIIICTSGRMYEVIFYPHHYCIKVENIQKTLKVSFKFKSWNSSPIFVLTDIFVYCSPNRVLFNALYSEII